jgi:hypothetical protein
MQLPLERMVAVCFPPWVIVPMREHTVTTLRGTENNGGVLLRC